MKFIRVNNSFINIEYIEFVEKQNDGKILVIMNSGSKLSFNEKEAEKLNDRIQIIVSKCDGW